MKRISSVLLGAAMLAATSGLALAADADAPVDYTGGGAWYLRGDLGYSWMDVDGDTNQGVAIGGGVGYQFNDNLRGDVRADWAGLGNDASMSSVLGNLYFDIPTSSMVTPYLGAGVGYGWAEDDAGRNTDGFAYALTAGAAVDLTDNLAADVGYRFRQIVSGDGAHDHEVLVGLRYKF